MDRGLDWMPWEKRKRIADKEQALMEIRSDIRSRMEAAEKRQKELDDEKSEGNDGPTERSTFEKARDGILGWFKREPAKEVRNEPESAPEVDSETTFTVPQGTKRIVVTITKPNGSTKTYTITNYLTIESGDIFHLRAL